MNSSAGTLVGLIFSLGIVLFVWLAIRSVVLWYFRINRIVELLEQIESNTRVGASSSQIDMDAAAINKALNADSNGTQFRDNAPPKSRFRQFD